MKFLIKFPTRSRPEKFKNTFELYQKFLSNNNEVEFVVSMDIDDETMNNDSIRDYLKLYKNTKYFYGDNKTKIEAINADISKNSVFDILILASDDMIPKEKNYDEIIKNDFLNNFKDTDCVLAYSDGRRNDSLITMTIIGKKYFDRFGYLYHPSYKSVYCDNEFTDVANKLKKVKYFDRCLFYHAWVDYLGVDQLLKRNESSNMYIADKAMYLFRKSKVLEKVNE